MFVSKTSFIPEFPYLHLINTFQILALNMSIDLRIRKHCNNTDCYTFMVRVYGTETCQFSAVYQLFVCLSVSSRLFYALSMPPSVPLSLFPMCVCQCQSSILCIILFYCIIMYYSPLQAIVFCVCVCVLVGVVYALCEVFSSVQAICRLLKRADHKPWGSTTISPRPTTLLHIGRGLVCCCLLTAGYTHQGERMDEFMHG